MIDEQEINRMKKQNITILLKEIGDIPEAASLRIPEYYRVIDVLKNGGIKAYDIANILELPKSYIQFAHHIQYARAQSIERLYRAYMSSSVINRIRNPKFIYNE